MADEYDLLERIRAGDQQALDDLYACYRPRLWRYLWHQLEGSNEWIEEVMQDVMLAVWTSAASFRGDAQLATWIFEIAHRLVLKAWRTHTRHHKGQISLHENPARADTREDDWVTDFPEEAIVGRLLMTNALEQLSRKHREVLDLVFFQGFSLDETARILGIPTGTVKSRLSYARQALLRMLGPAYLLEGGK